MVVVATDKGYLRFFTGSGVQRYIWRLGEEVVCMAAGEREVIVVHREGGTSLDGPSAPLISRLLLGLELMLNPSSGCQNLRFTLIDLETFDISQEGRVPLLKQTLLKWIGFSDQGVRSSLRKD